jgi:hypothetical protein
MSSHTFDLIKSLTQTEIRYFRVQSSLASKQENTDYVDLFNILLKQKVYDERLAMKAFKHNYFAQKKRHLLLKLLEILRAYNQGMSIQSQINNLISDYYILLNKSFYKQAQKSIMRAMFIAKHHERFVDIIRILQAETELYVLDVNAVNLENHIKKMRNELPHWMNLIDNKLAFEKEYLLFIKSNQEIELVRTEKEFQDLNRTVSTPLFSKDSNALSVSAKLQFHYIKGLYYYQCGDFKKSVMQFEKQFLCYKNNPIFATDQFFDFAKSLANTTLLYAKFGEAEKFETYYHQLLNINTKHNALKDSIDYWTYLLKLKFLVTQQQIQEADKWMSKHQNRIKLIEQKLSSETSMLSERQYVLFDSLMVLLRLKEFRKAHKLLQGFLNDTALSSKTDAVCLARIMTLFIQMELEQYDLVESNLRSIKRYLKEVKRCFEFESLCLDFIQSSLKTRNKQKIKTSYHPFYLNLLKLNLHPFEKNANCYFDLSVWIKTLY